MIQYKHFEIRLIRAGSAVALLSAMVGFPAHAQVEPVDHAAIALIREEGSERSQIMEIAWHLTDVFGPRLTGSPNALEAGAWARDRALEWGLSNARLEHWDPVAPGWTNERFFAHVVTPQAYPLVAYPEAWTPGTPGWVTGEAIIVPIRSVEDFEQYRGQLRGRFVLVEPPGQQYHAFDSLPWAYRYSDADLEERALAPTPQRVAPAQRLQIRKYWHAMTQLPTFLEEEEAAAWLRWGNFRGISPIGSVASLIFPPVWDPPFPVPIVNVLPEHYGRIYRMVDRAINVSLEMNIQNSWHEADSMTFNMIADIPGADRASEVVMMGAHLDSPHLGTAATDNAAGVSIVFEAARILKTLDLPMRRTVRVALWTGEEQGEDGSTAYVYKHLFDEEREEFTSQHADLSAYFNVDHGSGRFRLIAGATTRALADILERWIEPFREDGLTTVSALPPGGTDHVSFGAVGIPAFTFMQDLTTDFFGHASLDTYERLLEDELKQNAVILAALVYHAANHETLLPRPADLPIVKLSPDILDQYVGLYEDTPDYRISITRTNGRLAWRSWIPSLEGTEVDGEFRPISETEFVLVGSRWKTWRDMLVRISFTRDQQGKVDGLRFSRGERYIDAKRTQ